jgi:alpha-glucosidase
MVMYRFFIILLVMSITNQVFGEPYVLHSPDHRIKVVVSLSDLNSERRNRVIENALVYKVFFDNSQILKPSRLGFEIAGASQFNRFFKVKTVERQEHRDDWYPLYGEKNIYPENYNEMVIELKEYLPPYRSFGLIFRAYNEGIAFRYKISKQKGITSVTITDELTEFSFDGPTNVWESYGHEGVYSRVLSSEIREDCELPLTFHTNTGLYGAIMETGSKDYPRAYISPAEANAVKISLRGEAKGSVEFLSAWRAITLGESPGKLMENNYLLYNLNEPNQIEETNWIRPGTAIRETTLSTSGSKELIDFASDFGIDYIILDAHWYGPQFDDRSDPTKVNVVDYRTLRTPESHPGLNILEVIKYADEKNIGVWLYINFIALDRYIDTVLSVYSSWGVKGIKLGFVYSGKQEWEGWIERTVKKAADYQLMVNIHDAYRPTGLSRTYPNLLTQEGVRGNEHSPDARHNCTLPYTRYIIGPADYTPGYCRESLKNSRAHRLALPVIYYSPVQFLFWGEKITSCHFRSELSFWKGIPTVWDDTKVLDGGIGEYIIVARRKEEGWYIGGINGFEGRKVTITLDFLNPKMKYDAIIYEDDLTTGKRIISRRETVNCDTSLSLEFMENGGFAIYIAPHTKPIQIQYEK